jgi:hypothetical protein
MSEQCKRCSGRSLHSYLCTGCEAELREKMVELGDHTVATNSITGFSRIAPPMLEQLEIEALSMSKKGESSRRSSDQTSPLLYHERACELRDKAHDILYKWLAAISLDNETLGQE